MIHINWQRCRATRDEGDSGGESVYEGAGRVTATDVETGVASVGDDRAETLWLLADALDAHHGTGESVDTIDEHC